MLLLAECERILSGGEGNVMAASMLGNPGESGCISVSGTASVRLTEISAGFFCIFGNLDVVRTGGLTLGNMESCCALPLCDCGEVAQEVPALCGRSTTDGKLESCESAGGGVDGQEFKGSEVGFGFGDEDDDCVVGSTLIVGVVASWSSPLSSDATGDNSVTTEGLVLWAGLVILRSWAEAWEPDSEFCSSSHSSTSLRKDLTPGSAVDTLMDSWYGFLSSLDVDRDTTAAKSPVLEDLSDLKAWVLALDMLAALCTPPDELGCGDSSSLAPKPGAICDCCRAESRDWSEGRLSPVPLAAGTEIATYG